MKCLFCFCLTIFITILHAGCSLDELFDIKSDKNQATPTTLEDLQALLDNPSVFNSNSPLLTEIASDCLYFTSAKENVLIDVERLAYTWTKESAIPSLIEWQGGIGRGGYGRIYQANLILEVLEKIDRNIDPQFYDDVKGQVLFQRAAAYFELAQMFCPFYDSKSKGLKLGLPIRLKTDITAESVRSTLEETYSYINGDLMESVKYLPNLPQYKTRASKCAAFALLARYNLVIGNYSDGLKYSTLALGIWNKLIDYKSLNFGANSNPFIGFVDEVIYYSGTYTLPATSFTNLNVDSVLYKSYNIEDLRRKVFFRIQSGTGLIFYKGTYAGRGFNVFFSGLATDELYLIRAECNARMGKVFDSLKDLNQLLKSRWQGDYTELTASNLEDALLLVLEERKKELVFRGVRWSDLRRLNKDPRFARSFSRTFKGKTYTLEPNSYKYTFPLPDDVIQLSNMQQNPGWE